MLRSRRRRAVGLFALACLLTAGCGSQTATVSGKVTHRGKPVSGGSVIVYCSDKQIARGVTATDGTYAIPNVPHGTATVTVQALPRVPVGLQGKQVLPPAVNGPIPPTVEAPDPTKTGIPLRYSLPEESGLSVVIDRGTVTYDIDLKP